VVVTNNVTPHTVSCAEMQMGRECHGDAAAAVTASFNRCKLGRFICEKATPAGRRQNRSLG